jgi:hypothetical protein
MLQVVELLEHAAAGRPARIDREGGVIYGVRVLGEESANPPPKNNSYPRATREKAIGLLEGARVYLNHPPAGEEHKARRYEDGLGTIRGVRETGTGLAGDFHFNPKHPVAAQLLWDAEHAPHNLGFSINARGRVKSQGGRQVVEELLAVHSVDLVSRGATTRSLYEGLHKGGQAMVTVKQVLEKAYTGAAGREALRILENEVGAETLAKPFEAGEADVATDNAVKDAFLAACMTVLQNMQLDSGAKIKRLTAILKAQDKLTADKETAKEGYNPYLGRGKSLTERRDPSGSDVPRTGKEAARRWKK